MLGERDKNPSLSKHALFQPIYRSRFCPSNAKHIFPPEASPLLLRALRNLVEKGHIKPFSLFEVNSRVYGPFKPWPSRKYWDAKMDLLLFVRSRFGDCVTEDLDSNLHCKDYECDPNSKEYWCRLFDVFKRRLWLSEKIIRTPHWQSEFHVPKWYPIGTTVTYTNLYKYGIPIPYRPPRPPLVQALGKYPQYLAIAHK